MEIGWTCDNTGTTSVCDPICADLQKPGEECDRGNDNTCQCPWNQDETACDVCCNCALQTSPTRYCGDGIHQAGDEECDTGSSNSDTTPNACRTDCDNPSCGDGVVDNGEECDDGNIISGDGCSGTEVVSGVPTTGCREETGYDCGTGTCITTCGDGEVAAGVEACDDGNTAVEDCVYNQDPTFTCGEICTQVPCIRTYCGDNRVQSGHEECDTGSDNSDSQADTCRTTCALPKCGDGAVDSKVGVVLKLNQEFSGKTPDSTYQVNHANVFGATLTTENARAFYNFDGDDHLTVEDSASLELGSSPFTISFWVRPAARSANQFLIEKQSSWATGEYGLYLTNADNLVFQAYDAQAQVTVAAGVVNNAWNHVAVVYDGSTLAGYLNGTLSRSEAVNLNIANGSEDLFVGSRGGTGNFFFGDLDQIEIYKKALTAKQIAQGAANSVTELNYRFDTNVSSAVSNAIVDSSKAGRHGTLKRWRFGLPQWQRGLPLGRVFLQRPRGEHYLRSFVFRQTRRPLFVRGLDQL